MAKKFSTDNIFTDSPESPDSLGVHEVDRSLYGAIDIPDNHRVVAKPTELMSIYPDPVQPRRAIPLAFRTSGHPSQIPVALNAWISAAVQNLSPRRGIAIPRLLNNTTTLEDEGVTNTDDYQDLFDLISLAASIYRDGLLNPIAITPIAATNNYLLVAGERRYLACQMLYMYRNIITLPSWLKDGKIPARQTDRDVWLQATENGARKPLNAIGMARQLALLIMAMYENENTGFKPISFFLDNGQCDRHFYAQVSNGVAWRIKKGFSQRILDVTGLKYTSAITDYRRLLTIPDDMWLGADDENWALGRIQSAMGWKYGNTDITDMSAISQPNQPHQPSDDTEIDDDENDAEYDFSPPVSQPKLAPPKITHAYKNGMRVQHSDGTIMFVRAVAPAGVYVYPDMVTPPTPQTQYEFWTLDAIQFAPEETTVERSTPRVPAMDNAHSANPVLSYPDALFSIGQQLRVIATGEIGTCMAMRWSVSHDTWLYRINRQSEERPEWALALISEPVVVPPGGGGQGFWLQGTLARLVQHVSNITSDEETRDLMKRLTMLKQSESLTSEECERIWSAFVNEIESHSKELHAVLVKINGG